MLRRWTHTSAAQQIVVGSGALAAVPEILRSLGVRRAVVVTTRGRIDSEGGAALVARLGRVHAGTFDGVEPHVPAPVVQQGVGELRAVGADGLVSLGGGSAVDTAKALAFFLEHEAGAPGSGFADRPLLAHVAVPTTLAGAAYTPSFSMVDPHARRSTSTSGPTTTPSAVLVDLELNADLPSSLLGQSAVVAAAHGIEAAWSPDATPEARAIALAGLRGVARSAGDAVEEPGDVERRAPVLDAAVLCGRARSNAGDGLQQALAQLVGARAGIPHAAAHAALFVHTIRMLADAVPDAVAREVAGSLAPDATDPVDAAGSFLGSIGGAPGLAELGATDEDLDAVARQSGAHRGVQASLRPVGEADVRALLDDAS